MILLTRSVVLIFISIGAGMAAQETVNQLAIEDEQSDGAPLGALGTWSTAEGYYRANDVSHFQLAAAVESDSVPRLAMVAEIPETPEPTSAYDTEDTQTGRQADPFDGADAQLHPREFVENDPPPASAGGAANISAPEREPSVSNILPPPAKQTPTGDGRGTSDLLDRPDPAGYSRTLVHAPPPTSRSTVPPVRPVLSPYESERYLNPAVAVQRRAQQRAEERRRRIEAWKWLGHSPLRPSVSATPFTEGDSRRPAVIVIPYVVHERD